MEATIKWAKRVDPNLIRRLYESDAQNIQDIDLIDEIGYGLYARAESFIKVNRAHCDDVINCPNCNDEIRADEKMFACKCGWSILKKDYHHTYKGKQLVGVSVVPFAEKFISDWAMAKDNYSEKMKAIDYLIHSFHWELNEGTTRPAAINFISGKLMQIVELIFELAYAYDEKIYNEQMERWLENAKKSYWLRDIVIEKEKELKKNR